WPALLLNGTVVETGGRIVVSNLLLKDASCSFFIDALSVTGTRMRVSTAANMSARFTYVEPAGQIVNANVSDPCVHDLQVVYGGYFENLGATTAREVTEQALAEIQKGGQSVQPVVILISSDPDLAKGLGSSDAVPQSAITRPSLATQLDAPATALYATRAAHGREAVRQLRRLVSDHGGRVFHSDMCGNAPAPPLSWALSPETRTTINNYLDCNKDEIAGLTALLNATTMATN